MKKWMGLCSLLLTGCSFLHPIDSPNVNSYTITAYKPHVAYRSHGKNHGTLLMSTYLAAPAYRTSNMLYSLIPYKIKSYAFNQWVSPPDGLLSDVLATYLRESHLFSNVVMPPYVGHYAYHLTVRLEELVQTFMTPVSEVHLVVHATLLNNRGDLVASRTFHLVESAPENTPYGGVLATNRAAEKLSNQLIYFIKYGVVNDKDMVLNSRA